MFGDTPKLVRHYFACENLVDDNFVIPLNYSYWSMDVLANYSSAKKNDMGMYYR